MYELRQHGAAQHHRRTQPAGGVSVSPSSSTEKNTALRVPPLTPLSITTPFRPNSSRGERYFTYGYLVCHSAALRLENRGFRKLTLS